MVGKEVSFGENSCVMQPHITDGYKIELIQRG